MTGTLEFYDAAYPPASPPATDGVCVYIGGDATHVWTLAEITAQTARYRLPIFVRSSPAAADAAPDTAAAVHQLAAIGAPKGCLVAWDMETAQDPAYIRAVQAGMSAARYALIVYGSQSTVFGNDVPDGLYFGADWTGMPHLAAGDAMTQWVSFSGYDEDLARATLPFWDTRPAPEPAPEEETMANGTITGPAGTRYDIVCRAGAQPPKVTFGCSRDATIDVDTRQGKPMQRLALGYGATKSVEWPAGIDMLVVHMETPPVDGTPVSWAY